MDGGLIPRLIVDNCAFIKLELLPMKLHESDVDANMHLAFLIKLIRQG